MARIFEVHVLPAGNGDCIWIEYGRLRKSAPYPDRMVNPGTYKRLKKKIQSLNLSKVHFDLLVITHIDGDHIAGALELLERSELPVSSVTSGSMATDICLQKRSRISARYRGETDNGSLNPKKKLRWNATSSLQGGRVCLEQDGSPIHVRDLPEGP